MHRDLEYMEYREMWGSSIF